MAADFWAGYISGAIGIIIGNPLDLIKVRLQAGHSHADASRAQLSRFEKASSLVRGPCHPDSAIPIAKSIDHRYRRGCSDPRLWSSQCDSFCCLQPIASSIGRVRNGSHQSRGGLGLQDLAGRCGRRTG